MVVSEKFWRLLVICVLLAPVNSWANAWESVGFSGRSIGMGGAMIGGASGADAAYFNPAGLIRGKRRGAEVTIIGGLPLMNLDVESNPGLAAAAGLTPINSLSAACEGVGEADAPTCLREAAKYNRYIQAAKGNQEVNQTLIDRAQNPRNVWGVTLGGVLPVAYEPEDAWLAVGGAVFVPIGPVVYQRLKSPEVPFFMRYDDAPHRVVINAGGSAELPGNLRIGLGLDVLVDVVATSEIGLLVPPEIVLLEGGINVNPNIQDFRFYADGSIQLPVNVSPVAGIQYEPTDWLSMGVSYRHRQQVDIELAGDLLVYTGQSKADSVPLSLATSGVFTPSSLGGGVSVMPVEGLTINVDAVWKQWSKYKPPYSVSYEVSNIGNTLCHVFDNLEVSTIEDVLDEVFPADSNNPIDQQIRDLILTEKGELDLCELTTNFVGNDIDGETYKSKSEFKDVLEVALGMEYVIDELYAVRAGYRYQPTPIPAQTGVYNILDADMHQISGGFGILLGGLTVGLNVSYRLLSSRTVTKLTTSTAGKDDLGTNDPDLQDVLPDTRLTSSALSAQNDALRDAVEGRQYGNPLYPGYTIGGGYLTMGLDIGLEF